MTYFVFVDFENVPKVDLSLISGKPVHVTLLIGKHQTKIPTTLLEQSLSLHGQVAVVRLNDAGRDALDIALACYLGQGIERIPEANFSIISKDKGFDPMIAHLVKDRSINLIREDSFAALPFLLPPKPAAPAKTKPPFKVVAAKPAPVAKAPVTAKPTKAANKLEKLIKHLRNSPPSSRMKLEHMIEAFYKASLPAGGVAGVIDALIRQRIVTVNETGKVAVL